MLNGTLDDFLLPDIFRLLSGARKTGRLEVVRSAGRGDVFFRDGEVYFAESTLSRELVGQKLVRSGALTDGQLMSALDGQAESGGRLGEVLLASDGVTPEQLQTALMSQVEDAVFDLLRWEAGEFEWSPGVESSPEIAIAVSVENLIMEGSRRLDELALITRKIPSEESVIAMAPAPPEGAAQINITPSEWRVLVAVDGVRRVVDIADHVGLDVFDTMRTLYGLAATGLVHVPGFEPAPDEADAPTSFSVFEDPVVAEEPVVEPVDAEEPVPDAIGESARHWFEETAAEDDDARPDEIDPLIDEILTPEVDGVAVDKSTAVRELSNLFKQSEETDESQAFFGVDVAGEAAPVPRHRVEDDEEITRGLISRLIDGVKGL